MLINKSLGKPFTGILTYSVTPKNDAPALLQSLDEKKIKDDDAGNHAIARPKLKTPGTNSKQERQEKQKYPYDKLTKHQVAEQSQHKTA